MITKRDIKVFLFSLLFSALFYALFNQSLKSAEAQGREARDKSLGRGICSEHAKIAGEKHDRNYDATINHSTIAGEKHDLILVKLDELLSR